MTNSQNFVSRVREQIIMQANPVEINDNSLILKSSKVHLEAIWLEKTGVIFKFSPGSITLEGKHFGSIADLSFKFRFDLLIQEFYQLSYMKTQSREVSAMMKINQTAHALHQNISVLSTKTSHHAIDQNLASWFHQVLDIFDGF